MRVWGRITQTPLFFCKCLFSYLKSKTKQEIEDEQETEPYGDCFRFTCSIFFAGRADKEDEKKRKPLP